MNFGVDAQNSGYGRTGLRLVGSSLIGSRLIGSSLIGSRSRSIETGFTLIELIVAVSIFAAPRPPLSSHLSKETPFRFM